MFNLRTDLLQHSHLHVKLLFSWLSQGAPFNHNLYWFDAAVARHTLIGLSLAKVNPARIEFDNLGKKPVLQRGMRKTSPDNKQVTKLAMLAASCTHRTQANSADPGFVLGEHVREGTTMPTTKTTT